MAGRGGDGEGFVATPAGSVSAEEVERIVDARLRAHLASHDERVDALTAAVAQLAAVISENSGRGAVDTGAAPAAGDAGEARSDERIDALVRVIDRMAKHLQVLDAAVRSRLLDDDDR